MTTRKAPVKHIVRGHAREGGVKVSPYWRGKGQLPPKKNKPAPSYYGSVVETVKDTNGITYKIINSTAYHVDTPDAVIGIIERNMHGDSRLKFYFGDPKTGRDWDETYGTTGYIGRSGGLIKIPLLVNNRRSMGGPALLDDSIVRITRSTAPHTVLYQHPNYHKESG